MGIAPSQCSNENGSWAKASSSTVTLNDRSDF